MNEKEVLAMTARAIKVIEEWESPLIIETDIRDVVAVIAMAQLALRHPRAKQSATGRTTEKFIVELIEKLDPEHGDLWKVLNMGFNPVFDYGSAFDYDSPFQS